MWSRAGCGAVTAPPSSHLGAVALVVLLLELLQLLAQLGLAHHGLPGLALALHSLQLGLVGSGAR
jgi:hypothetical protein